MEKNLEVRNLNKSYPNSKFKLKNISFSVPYGAIVGFVGENGAGKTTTMRTILGALKKESGSIKVFGEEMNDVIIKIRENIGVVFDNMNFSGNLNVNEISKVMRNIYKQWNQDKFLYYIEKFSLPKNQKIKSFSRGMSMKLSIAVALSHNPKLLILDEATSGLDPIVREEILDIFLDFVKNKKRSILLSSHIISDIEKVADYLIFIKKGEIILNIDKEALLNNYGIFICHNNELHEFNKYIVATDKNRGEYVKVLVSNKNALSKRFAIENSSLDDITRLLLKGDKR